MANPYAGEVELIVDGKPCVAKLTLGALVELEEGLDTGSLVDLVERFEAGRVATRDVVAVVLAGLRGGGWSGDSEALLKAEIGGGPMEAARVAGRLLARAFANP